MKYAWIIGRFGFVGIVLVGISLTIGCEQPLSVWRLFLTLQDQQASSDTDVRRASFSADDLDSKSLPDAKDLVADWEKPIFALFITGRQHGYIEPCGCTGLTNQKGGLLRRHSTQKILLNERGWDLVSIDAGNQVRRFGQQPLIKLEKTYEAICRAMDYDVVGMGPDDLKIPSIDYAQTILNAPEGANPFTCANVEVVDAQLSNKFVVIEKNGKRIGVTMVLGDEHLPDLRQASDLTVESPADGLSKVVPQLKAARCDLNVLIAHASLDKCRALAKQFPHFDLLITAGGAGDPTMQPEAIKVSADGRVTSMIQVGVKGMYVGIVGYYENNGQASIKYERVALDGRFEDSPEIKKIFIDYQNDLKQLWQAGQLADIKPRLHPSGHSFVGSDACADCHDEEFVIWEDGHDGDGGPHAHATKSLTEPNERSWVLRHYDPECVSCHMTGWNPQGFYPYQTGYLDINQDDALYNNGCENCHGPGSAHIDAENNHADDEALLDKLRSQMRVTLEEARQSACMECHDLDNSPDFVKEGAFDEYWPAIEH
jgi:hypothetical protein